mgnify:CR=1 FL=1
MVPDDDDTEAEPQDDKAEPAAVTAASSSSSKPVCGILSMEPAASSKGLCWACGVPVLKGRYRSNYRLKPTTSLRDVARLHVGCAPCVPPDHRARDLQQAREEEAIAEFVLLLRSGFLLIEFCTQKKCVLCCVLRCAMLFYLVYSILLYPK